MKPTLHSLAAGAAVSAVFFAGSSAGADPVNYLVLGDSISTNVGATNPYSYYLQDLLVAEGLVHGVDYDFLGGQSPAGAGTKLSDGVTDFDGDLWGRAGYLASNSPNSGLRGPTENLEYDLANATFSNGGINDGVFTTQDGGTRSTAVADVILLHIGTNAIRNDDPDTSFATTSPFTQLGVDQLGSLFGELRTQWDNGNIATDAKIFVANILPKGELGSANDNVNDDTLRNSAIYNSRIQGVIDALPENDAADIAFKALFVDPVDLFKIEATQQLADSLGVSLSDIDIDSDQWVDWLYLNNGSDLAFDESDPLAAGNISSPTDTVVANTNILNSDQVHPTDLGYELVANVWFEALVAEGVVPEPSSLALFGLGGLVLVRRRR